MQDRDAPLTGAEAAGLDWEKANGLIPAIVQDAETLQVLMLGFMSREALEATLSTGKVVFHSRTRNRLWQKGETSGNSLTVRGVQPDCDGDALLILAEPAGPTCHLGTTSCFGGDGPGGVGWLGLLGRIVRACRQVDPAQSYTARLLADGPIRIAQKVGEEGVELALAAAAQPRRDCVSEAADLLYHLTVLIETRGFSWSDIAEELRQRHYR